jgi:thiol-disulfide isomerase/thioredoxin
MVGCIQPSHEESSEPPAMANAAQPDNSPHINLVIGDENKFDELLAKHKGKVIFVDFWATWCGPCVEYFPHTVETHNKYKDKDFATIAVSFDLLESEPQVREFLAKNNAAFDNLLSSYDDVGQEVAAAFDWEALPELRLYDRTGKLRYEWTSKPEDLELRIEELLAEP